MFQLGDQRKGKRKSLPPTPPEPQLSAEEVMLKIARNCLSLMGVGEEGKQEKFQSLKREQKQTLKATQVSDNLIINHKNHYLK